MNNQVLRRKLFDTVLRDARQPQGILASSSELADTVQRRANGGMQTDDYEMRLIPKLAAEGNVKALEGIATGTGYSTKVRNAARQAIGSLMTKQTSSPADITEVTQDVGTGFSNIGNAILQTITPGGAREAREKRRSLREPSPDDTRFERFIKGAPTLPGIMELAGDASEGILGVGRYLFDDKPYDITKDDVSIDPRVRSPFTPGPIKEEEMLDDEYTSISDQITPVSGVDTQSRPSESFGEGRKVSTVAPSSEDIASQVEASLSPVVKSPEAVKLEGLLESTKTKNQAALTELEASLDLLKDEAIGLKKSSDQALTSARDAATKASARFDEVMKLKRAEAKEFTLDDVKDEAMKLSGIKPGQYDDKRENAIWFNLMRAGLSMAAGQSDNALTNIAKGLSIGLEGYGQDIGNINSQEREDRKELRNLQISLIKDKNARSIAEAAAENDYNYNQQRLAQAASEGADTRLLQAQSSADATKLALTKLDTQSAFQINQLEKQAATEEARLGLDIAKMNQQDRQLAEQRSFDEWKANLAATPKEFWQVIQVDGFATQDEDGTWSLTPDGEKYYKRLISASLTSGTKVTDLDKKIRNIAAGSSIQGIPLAEDQTSRLEAAGIWVSNYKDEYDNAAAYEKRGVLERYLRDANAFLDPDMPINVLDQLFPDN